MAKTLWEALFIYLFIYLSIYLLFIYHLQLTNLQLKTDIILYTNKNSYVFITKKHANHVNYVIKTF